MADRRSFFIRMGRHFVPVSEEIYRAYYRARRHERYLEEKDAAHGLVHYAAFDSHRSNGEEELPDEDAECVADIAVRRVMAEKLHDCLGLLHDGERALIRALFFEGKTEREYSAETGIPQQTINSRRARILTKLKKLMKS